MLEKLAGGELEPLRRELPKDTVSDGAERHLQPKLPNLTAYMFVGQEPTTTQMSVFAVVPLKFMKFMQHILSSSAIYAKKKNIQKKDVYY